MHLCRLLSTDSNKFSPRIRKSGREKESQIFDGIIYDSFQTIYFMVLVVRVLHFIRLESRRFPFSLSVLRVKWLVVLCFPLKTTGDQMAFFLSNVLGKKRALKSFATFGKSKQSHIYKERGRERSPHSNQVHQSRYTKSAENSLFFSLSRKNDTKP